MPLHVHYAEEPPPPHDRKPRVRPVVRPAPRPRRWAVPVILAFLCGMAGAALWSLVSQTLFG